MFSISNYGEDIPSKDFSFIPNLIHIQFFRFNDVDGYGNNAMTKRDAERIAIAVKNYQNAVDTIIVSCDAGISRSAGIGAALDKYFNGDDMRFFTSPRFNPNMHCYSLTLEALCGNAIDEEYYYERKNISDNLFFEDCDIEFDNFGNIVQYNLK